MIRLPRYSSRHIWIPFLALGAGLAAAAGGSQPRSVSPPRSQDGIPDTSAITPELINAGRRVFHGSGTCFGCHGMGLEGGPIAPTLKAHAWKDAKAGDLAQIYRVVIHGVLNTAMLPRPGGISADDAAHVSMYVWAVSHRGAKP